ncbi:MAG: tRNA preQ1(34) S-adenosylmethionine ribosyltransferase-isomerase QueA [Candidatus Moranbacteria bacterium RIFCSPHIGHO2_01_FULL_55_24]|nr:MAG: tRNA preQ1(34) S-adenosylmethionine ribosyltransferase-isomerase QueA [Candidatus Moranbacteria bacterium RIFCSPHIGHO2_01_FULL_55_24]
MEYKDLEQYDYTLPEELIRKRGIEPRDAARLFVYDTKTDEIRFDTFSNLALYLPDNALLVRNDTRVRPSRLWLAKETGGKIEVFALLNQMESEERIPALVDRKTTVGQKLFFPDGNSLTVRVQDENIFYMTPSEGNTKSFQSLVDEFGKTPLPHYLEDVEWDEREARLRYQTTFAKEGASVAAPTAGLHFTERVEERLEEKGIESRFITLDVGLGTFAPLQEEHFKKAKLHAERVHIPEETVSAIERAKSEARPVIAVGTTTVRSLEFLAHEGIRGEYNGATDIFIRPPYEFLAVDGLITNFHLPKTSLLLLVDAFLRSKGSKRGIMELYRIAIQEKFAFYSFGDSMLIV